MNHRGRQISLLLLVATAALALLPAMHADSARASAKPSAAALSLKWYDRTAKTITAAAYPEQVTQSRAWAMSWLAAAQAVRKGKSRTFRSAAFVTALHYVLVELVPDQRAQLDAALKASLAKVPRGRIKRVGRAAGENEAATVLEDREADGLDTAAVNAPWTPPPAAPGVWQPTPPSFDPAVRAGLGGARSFLLARNDQFHPQPPPALDSEAYLASLAEVRDIGSASSATRTAEQTDIAGFWAQSSIGAYTQVLRSVLVDEGSSLVARATLVAAFHVITIDAQIAIHEAKYRYVFWRPVTAIREGTVDPDPSWTPMIDTPRHPEYPSGHAGYAGAAERVLEELVGSAPAKPISVSSPTAPGSTRTFDRWSTLTQENVDGRVWEGVHFRFSDEIGAEVGRQVADYDLSILAEIGL